ncbi:MAG: GAF domain-containing protein [Candidatus Edwardsbacteria bacterium]|jgi:diguanylate cyclase (GGDEF)-like protein|nr:GAF domain-containing protein [Candidatus Edwardsbacteria bacterium]
MRRDDTGSWLVAAPDRERLLRAAVDRAARRFGAAAVLLVNRDPGELPVGHCRGASERFIKARVRLWKHAGQRWPTRRHRLLPAAARDQFARALLIPFGYDACITAEIAVPPSQRHHGGAFALELYFTEPGRADARLATEIKHWTATVTAAAANRFEVDALQRENRELLTLAAVGQIVAGSLDSERVFEAIYKQLLRLVKPRNMLLALAEPEEQRFRVIFEYEHGKKGKPSFFPMAAGLATLIWRRKQGIVTSDYLAACRSRRVRPSGPPAKAWLGVPLLGGGRCLGVLLMWDYLRGDSFSPADVRIVQHLANQAATAIINARIHEGNRRQLAEISAITKIGQAISKVMTLDRLWPLLHRQLRQLMDAGNFYIALYHPVSRELEFVYDMQEGKARPVEKRGLARGLTEYVIDRRRPLLLASPRQRVPSAKYRMIGRRAQSWLGVPILSKGAVLGVMAIQHYRQPHCYDAHHQELLEIVAGQVSVAIENTSLYQTAQRRVTELSALRQVNEAAVTGTDIDQVLRRILTIIKEQLGGLNCAILLPDEDRGRLYIRQALGYSGRAVRDIRLAIGREGITGRVAQSGATVYVPDVRVDQRYVQGSARCRSELAIPLAAGGTIVGVLDIERAQVDGFSPADIGLFENLAKQAALVIAKVRSEESSRQRIRELSTLFTMFQSFNIGVDFHELCGKIAEKIGQSLEAQKCLIALIDPAGTEVTGAAGYLAGQLTARQTARFGTREALARSLRFKLGKGGVAPRVIGSGQPYLTNDARRDPVILRRFAEEFQITRLLVLPLSTRGKALGLAYVADPADGRDFHDDDVRLAKALAGQAALIMDNARLYHEMGQGLKQVTTLYQMSQAITQASSLPDVLDLAVTIISQLVPADYLSIMLWDPSRQWLSIKAARGLDQRTVRDARFRPGQGLAGWVAQHGQPVITEDLRRDPRFQSIGQAEDIGPAISVPLLSGDKVLGVLNIDNRASHRAAFTQEHLQLALTMGGTIALAIERAELVASLDGRVSVQKALMETGTLLLSSLEFRAVLEKIASEIQKLIPFLAMAIYAVDWDKRQLQPIMARGPFESEMLNDLPFSMDSGITGAIAQSGAPEIVNDTNHDPRAVHIEGTSDESQNLMAVPFVVQGRAAAVLALWRDLGHEFSAAELEIAALFANQAAVALNNARLFEEIRSNEKEVADTNNRLNLALKRQIEVNTELSTLQYLSSTILSSLKLEEILSVIVEGIRSSLGFDSVLISLVDRSGQYLEHKAASGFAPEVHERLMRERPGLHEYLPLMRPEHRISNSYFWSKDAEVAFSEIMRPAGDARPATGRWHPDDKLLIPLHSKEKELLAIIQVGKPVNEAVPDKKKVRSLEAFANTAVLAIENATLYQQAQSRINELSLLYDIGIVVTSVLETGKLLDSVVRVIREKLHYLKVAVLMVDAQTRSIYTGSQVGFQDDQHVEYRSVGGDSLAGQVAERGEPMVVSEAHKDPRYVAVDDRVHSAVAVPIKREGRVVGILNIEDSRSNAFADSDVKLLTTLASQVSVALDNARLYEEAKRQINELSVLHDVSTTVGSTLKVEALLSQVCQILQETFRYPKISILLTDQERRQLELVASRGYRVGDQRLGTLLRIGQDGVTGMVAATGEPIIIEDVTTSSQYISIDGNTRSEIAVPLKLGGQMIGVINVESDNLGAFGSLDLRLLTTLAAQVAVAVENARLYEQTEQLAVTDGLTGIFNHRYFQEFFERELNRAKRYRHSLSLIMLDIDHFKQVNDSHGHPSGDRVLQQVAAVLRTQARDVDLVARYGGEEFMVVLPETRKREAMILANRIRVQVRDITFKDEHDRDLDRITVSLGVASFPEDGGTKSDLIDYVDKALYRAKAAGRDQVKA